jgi:UDP-N-acetylmuramoylalanine--D-glutamate ligase
MIRLPALAGQRVAVMGLGVAGLATARALAASGADVWAWDDGAAARQAAGAEGIALVDLADADWRGIGTLVLSPGIPHSFPAPHPVAERARAAGAEIVCDVELLARADAAADFVGITGTNGKSTTTALLAHILTAAGRKHAVGGNLGPAALGLAPQGEGGLYVLELSSFQLERVATLRLAAAALLNVAPNHLDRHGDLSGYVAAKRHIFDRAAPGALAVIGDDDDESRKVADRVRGRPEWRLVPITSGRPGPGMVGAAEGWLVDAREAPPRRILDLAAAPALPGAHNAQNAAAAYALARHLNVPAETIAAAMRSFPGLAHRQERIGAAGGVVFVNDSKATTAEAAARALSSYARVFWIAGGRSKAAGYAATAPFLPRVAEAFLIGEAAGEIAAFLGDHGVRHRVSGTLERALADAAEAAGIDAAVAAGADTGPQGVVLLSPACASYDQFKSFEARGDRFRALVRQRLGRAAGQGEAA